MSSARVLVGTRKGAFVLTSDGKRKKWDVSGPHFAGWEIYHVAGIACGSGSTVRVAVERLVRAGDSAIERRREDVGAGGQQVHVRRRAGHAPVVRWHRASLGVQARVASRAIAEAIPTPCTRVSRTPRSFVRRDGGQNWEELSGLRKHGSGPRWQPGAGGMCLHTIILDPVNPNRMYIAISAAGAFRTDDGGEELAPDQPGAQVAVHPRSDRGGWPLRAQDRDASARARMCFSCRNIGT